MYIVVLNLGTKIEELYEIVNPH